MYSAIIIEPRRHKALEFVLGNFLENLSDEWNIIIFHGNLNIEFVNDIIENKLSQYKNRVSFANLGIDNLTRQEYSDLLITDVAFYNTIPTETFLIFQTDTMIFKKYSNLINQFLEYDYVGAPWGSSPTNDENNVGNGGLSLRKKSKMREIIEKEKNPDLSLLEDVFFSCNKVVPLYKPSFEEAKLFSVEHVFSEITFGCHQPWLIRDNLIEFFPEIETLILLNDK